MGAPSFGTFVPLLWVATWLPYVVIGGLMALLACGTRSRMLTSTVRSLTRGLALAGFLLVPAMSAVSVLERGFDCGPFYPQTFNGDLLRMTPDLRLPFRNGCMLVFNREEDAATSRSLVDSATSI